jgi:hypothetical protein
VNRAGGWGGAAFGPRPERAGLAPSAGRRTGRPVNGPWGLPKSVRGQGRSHARMWAKMRADADALGYLLPPACGGLGTDAEGELRRLGRI